MNDLISIIIPLYNRQDVIEECIRSVLDQSYQNFEIILIDDGSTDQTMAVCRDLAKDEPRIKLLAGEHAGVSTARNIGIEAAAGAFLFFLDSDDVIHPRLLETLVSSMMNSDAAISGTSVFNIWESHWSEAIQKHLCSSIPGDTVYLPHEKALHYFMTTPTPITLIGGVMMRRDLIGDTRFRTDLFIAEDYYFIYENLIKGASAVFLKPKWYYCRLHQHNSSWNYDFEGFWTRFHRWELVWKSEEAFGRTEYANAKKRAAFSVYLQCMRRQQFGSKEIKKNAEGFEVLSKGTAARNDFRWKNPLLPVRLPSLYLSGDQQI